MLLPGVSTLARLVARVRDAAMHRLWDTLAERAEPGSGSTYGTGLQ